VLRFRNELAAIPDLRGSLAATTWQAIQFLAAGAGGEEGPISIADAAQALLEGAPAR